MDKSDKIVHIKDGFGSVQFLLEAIEDIRAGRMKKFICITQIEIDISDDPDLFVVDESGEKLPDDKVSTIKNYYYGDCYKSELLGLVARLGHIINREMDGYRFGDDED